VEMDVKMIVPMLEIVFSIITLVFILQISGRFFQYYKLGENGIEIYFFFIRVSTIPYISIQDIRMINWGGVMINPGISYINRPLGSRLRKPFGEYVLLQKKNGLFKNVLISPDRPEDFVEFVNCKVHKV
jgi:hypothetical protein